jgi:hypothetical protein
MRKLFFPDPDRSLYSRPSLTLSSIHTDFVPEGRTKVAQQFTGGIGRAIIGKMSPVGTIDFAGSS